MDSPPSVTLRCSLPSCHVHLVQDDGQKRSATLQVVWGMFSNASHPACTSHNPGHNISVGTSDGSSAGTGKGMVATYLAFSKFFFALPFNTGLAEGRTRYGLLDELCLIKSLKLCDWSQEKPCWDGAQRAWDAQRVQLPSCGQPACWNPSAIASGSTTGFRGRTAESFVSLHVKSTCPPWPGATAWWDSWEAVRAGSKASQSTNLLKFVQKLLTG